MGLTCCWNDLVVVRDSLAGHIKYWLVLLVRMVSLLYTEQVELYMNS